MQENILFGVREFICLVLFKDLNSSGGHPV